MNLFAKAWDLLIKELDPDNFTFDELLTREKFASKKGTNRNVLDYLLNDPDKRFQRLRAKKIDADLDMTARDIAPFEPKSKWTAQEEMRDAIGGGFSAPGKMLNRTYSLPTHMCKVGGRLREVPGSVCHNCYAHPSTVPGEGGKAFTYAGNAAQRHLLRNYNALKTRPEQWASALAAGIPAEAGVGNPLMMPDFRWHDAGDIDSPQHLAMMLALGEKHPGIFNWIPTREWDDVGKVMNARGELPPNVALRLSIPHIDQTLDNDINEERGVELMPQKHLDMLDEFPQLLTTGVVSDPKFALSRDDICLVSGTPKTGKRFKTCQDAQCYACYDPKVRNRDFVQHN